MSRIRSEFLEWQKEKLGTAFIEDEQFFLRKYGTHITPLCKDLFKELLEIDARLARIESRKSQEVDHAC